MPDNGQKPSAEPKKDYTPPLPEQLRKQLAQADQIRADIKTVSEPSDPSTPTEGTPPQPAGPEPSPPWARSRNRRSRPELRSSP